MKKLLILLISFTFATELEVDGNLKINGTLDANGNSITNVGAPQTMTDAINTQTLNNILNNNGPFEIEYFQVVFSFSSQQIGTFTISYRGLNQETWATDWQGFINQKSLEGWYFNQLQMPGDYYVYELIRPISED